MRTNVVCAALTAIALAAIILCGSALSADLASAATPRAVALSDASYPPDRVVYVKPGRSVTILRQCGRGTVDGHGGFFTESSAYRWNGAKLPAQRWIEDHTLSTWGKVSWDGVTVTNRYSFPVLFAGWCS